MRSVSFIGALHLFQKISDREVPTRLLEFCIGVIRVGAPFAVDVAEPAGIVFRNASDDYLFAADLYFVACAKERGIKLCFETSDNFINGKLVNYFAGGEPAKLEVVFFTVVSAEKNLYGVPCCVEAVLVVVFMKFFLGFLPIYYFSHAITSTYP